MHSRTSLAILVLSLVAWTLVACSPSTAPSPTSVPAQTAPTTAPSKPSTTDSSKPAAPAAATPKPAEKSAAQSAPSAVLSQLIEGAKKESLLRASWGATTFGGAAGLDELVAGMNKQYGLNIKAQFTPGIDMQAMVQKLAQEMAAGQPASTDVYLGNSQGMLDSLKVKVFRPMDWASILPRQLPSEPGLDPVAPGGIGVVFQTRVVGVTYNSDLVKGDDVPRGLEDILNPKWKGKIAATPYASGLREFGRDDMLGMDYTRAYAQKLSRQIAGLIRCGENDRIVSGEFWMLAFDCGGNEAVIYQKRGAPLAQTVMKEGTVLHHMYGAVPVHSRAPNAAALLIAYMHSPEGQAILWNHDGADLHLYPESKVRPQVETVRKAGGKIAINTVQGLQAVKNATEIQNELVKILREASQ